MFNSYWIINILFLLRIENRLINNFTNNYYFVLIIHIFRKISIFDLNYIPFINKWNIDNSLSKQNTIKWMDARNDTSRRTS